MKTQTATEVLVNEESTGTSTKQIDLGRRLEKDEVILNLVVKIVELEKKLAFANKKIHAILRVIHADGWNAPTDQEIGINEKGEQV